MELIRYLFLLCIIVGCTSIGFILSRGYADRVNELNDLSILINILQNKIKFTQLPLQEIFEELGNIKLQTKIHKIFLICSENLKKMKMEKAWEEAIEEGKRFFYLNEEDIEVLNILGSTLGKTDINGQMNEINEIKERIGLQIQQAEKEKNKNSKMYKSLGTITGLGIVILLF